MTRTAVAREKSVDGNVEESVGGRESGRENRYKIMKILVSGWAGYIGNIFMRRFINSTT
jgi:hypothetical protein